MNSNVIIVEDDSSKNKVTKQAHLIVGFGIIVALAILIVQPKLWLVALTVAVGFFIAAYNVNCTVKGHCTTWSWLLTFFYLIYSISLLVITFGDKKKMIKALSFKK